MEKEKNVAKKRRNSDILMISIFAVFFICICGYIFSAAVSLSGTLGIVLMSFIMSAAAIIAAMLFVDMHLVHKSSQIYLGEKCNEE